MKGIVSPCAAPSAARLLIGGHLLLFVQTCLILGSQAPRQTVLLILIAIVTVTAGVALVAALIGEPSPLPPALEDRRDGE